MAQLHAVMYHYIRDPEGAPFPRLHAMPLGAFRAQVAYLKTRYEMATFECVWAFLRGEYRPSRDLCILTFDDGLREHAETVMPLLADAGIEGWFFPITSCLDDRGVAPVHMSHFLMAKFGNVGYRDLFLQRLTESGNVFRDSDVNPDDAARTYRWDDPETACFKYLFNFVLPEELRNALVRTLFVEEIGSEKAFARQLYFDWDEARGMQRAGMVIGGHSHAHRALSSLRGTALEQDLKECRQLLSRNLDPQPLWPFSYPYGKPGTYPREASDWLPKFGFDCAFCTTPGSNAASADRFQLRRLDAKDVS